MKINRSNYEIWFIDWADNNLDKAQQAELNHFLEENPDLFEEFREFSAMKPVSLNNNPIDKESLKKSAASLSSEQFDHMCIAYLEGDQTAEQKVEFIAIKDSNPERARAFKMISSAKLNPPALTFQGKKSLYRKTIFERAAIVLLIPLSTAAALAAIMLISPLFRQEIRDQDPIVAENIKRDSITIKKPERVTGTLVRKNAIPRSSVKTILPESADSGDQVKPGLNSAEKERTYDMPIEKITAPENVIIADLNLRTSLIESDKTFTLPVEDDGRSNIGKFLARTFREKILNEKQVSDAPLKGYELAEAGIEGLNKLLGWEMALDTNTGNNGEVESVHFNSRIIKFSAPVKKSETAE
jgi:hypothetical protein